MGNRKDFSSSLVRFSHFKIGRTKAQGGNIFFPRLHKLSSMYGPFSQAYYTQSIFHISVDNWVNKKIVLVFAQYLSKCVSCKIKF